MSISFEIPQDIEHQLRTDGVDLNREAKEAFLVEQYRHDKISQHQLAQALGMSRYEADGVLKRHGVALESTVDELRAEGEFLRAREAGMNEAVSTLRETTYRAKEEHFQACLEQVRERKLSQG